MTYRRTKRAVLARTNGKTWRITEDNGDWIKIETKWAGITSPGYIKRSDMSAYKKLERYTVYDTGT